MSRKVLTAFLAVVAAAVAVPSSASAGQALYATTAENRLILINSSAPAHALRDVAIRGLPANERIVGLDIRPNTGQLYGLGASSRVYILNPATGLAGAIGAGPFTPLLSGTLFGLDFNPTVDRLRTSSDTDQNLRLNPTNGAVVATDGNYAYAAGDPNAGQNPVVEGIAYTNSVATATSTELFGIDTARNVLVKVNPPNNGTLATVGAIGVDAQSPAAFDVGVNGTGYATFKVPGQTTPALHTINLATGAAAAAAGTRSVTGRNIVAIAAAGTLPDDNTKPDVSISLSSTQLESRLKQNDSVQPGVACDETCVITAQLRRGGTTLGTGTTGIIGAGKTLVKIPLSNTAVSIINREGTELFDVRVTVVDAAGNTYQDTRQFRTRLPPPTE